MTLPLPDLAALRAGVVTVDLHRGHLDPDVATMPLPADAAARVVRANVEFLDGARARGIQVVHVVTGYHGVEEVAMNPWWRSVADSGATRAAVLRHQLPGSPGLELMPGLLEERQDVVVRNKKRYDSFAGTELSHVLTARGIDTLLLTGVNTNSCVLATAIAANVRDYSPVVVEDCVDTMDPALHGPALDIVRQAFGWVGPAKEILAVL